jgi:PST family polysaccharide transporter
VKSNVIKNTMMLYGMSIAKIVFPLLTLPYLTRVLSVESYGVVSYVKAVMQYMQLVVDFGFMLSGTKDIVNAKNDHEKLEKEVGDILLARVLLAAAAFVALLGMIAVIPLLRANIGYTLLAFVTVFLSVFLFDYFFRGIEKMQVITLRFVAMRGIATALTFIFVHSDKDILFVPLLDAVGSLVAVILVFVELKKENIKIHFSSVSTAWKKLKNSFVYFASNMATAFGALNTLLIGAFLPATEVAYWSVCMQLIGAVQTMYTPITDGIYPEMIKTKSWKFIKRLLMIFMPIVFAGSAFSIAVAPYVLQIVGGEQYIAATSLFRALVPVLIFSFPGIVLGWPTLGALDKAAQVTKTTILSAVVQVASLLLLIATGHFTVMWIAIFRCVTEFVLMASRGWYCWKYRREFC